LFRGPVTASDGIQEMVVTADSTRIAPLLLQTGQDGGPWR
jgi:hypothetical protein